MVTVSPTETVRQCRPRRFLRESATVGVASHRVEDELHDDEVVEDAWHFEEDNKDDIVLVDLQRGGQRYCRVGRGDLPTITDENALLD